MPTENSVITIIVSQQEMIYFLFFIFNIKSIFRALVHLFALFRIAYEFC